MTGNGAQESVIYEKDFQLDQDLSKSRALVYKLHLLFRGIVIRVVGNLPVTAIFICFIF